MARSDAPLSFTLVELLIVTAVILLMTGFSLASYNQYTEDRRLDAEANKVVNMLFLAHKKALSGDTSQCADPAAELLEYEVSFTASGLQISPSCSHGSADASTLNLETDIVFNPVPGSVTFAPLSGKIPGAGTEVIVYNNKNNRCKKITISAAGVIDTATSCP
ncbi:prepilin-type N-terminal cleavage/methylation domain-containing protein [Patescibacteria group bacterium]|nr:prepilin-type N-terminal cleavage/methylation domain-containing protein [Patescibacteria group bacterium]MCL5091864.1 prepilin-type N-terminal cleavage/methylation domain-containing protein [Patescibacteria group bacterium]